MKKNAYLFGPFIGEFEWEMYRFAPYAIYLKKQNPKRKLIVYTRPNRFDLYGKYADILIPLNLKENTKRQRHFGIVGFDNRKYKIIIDYFYKKYSKRFQIIEHIFPDISVWRNNIKWQFPRSQMDYDFRPRNKNKEIVEHLIDSSNNVFVTVEDSEIRHFLVNQNYNPFMIHWFEDICEESNKASYFGSLILYLKTCKFVVGNMNSSICRLALLLKIPVISINETMSYDKIHLLNPFDVPVINCKNIKEGFEIYENNF